MAEILYELKILFLSILVWCGEVSREMHDGYSPFERLILKEWKKGATEIDMATLIPYKWETMYYVHNKDIIGTSSTFDVQNVLDSLQLETEMCLYERKIVFADKSGRAVYTYVWPMSASIEENPKISILTDQYGFKLSKDNARFQIIELEHGAFHLLRSPTEQQ